MWQSPEEYKSLPTCIHLPYLFIFSSILCVLEKKHPQTSAQIHRNSRTFSGSINMRICCDHARSITSGGKEPFHILWIRPSPYTQWRQFKCKSWHSHHSASRHFTKKPRRIGTNLNEPQSESEDCTSHLWQIMREILYMNEMVVMYAAQYEIVYCPFFRRVIPASLTCHVQYPVAIES